MRPSSEHLFSVCEMVLSAVSSMKGLKRSQWANVLKMSKKEAFFES